MHTRDISNRYEYITLRHRKAAPSSWAVFFGGFPPAYLHETMRHRYQH